MPGHQREVARRTSEIGGRSSAAGRLTIGRSPDNDIVVVDRSVSREHAVLVRDEGGAWRVSDLGSRNGTSVNGRAVEPGCDAHVKAGDRIGLGDAVVLFDRPPIAGATQRSTASVDTGSVGRHRALVGRTRALREAVARLERVALSPLSVLITGESGTGKELAAELVHGASPRRRGPFVIVNCPALPESLFEAELFGVESRVATGVDPRKGRLEQADGGTLFLDEVGEMALGAQAKLLRFLQDKRVERIGGRTPVEVDVRIVAATNSDLEDAVQKGSFRLDLYNRLSTLSIRLPPLRERREDIPLLVEHFLALHGRSDLALGAEALAMLAKHPYPGNVRQLQRFVLSAATFTDDAVIGVGDLPEEARAGETPTGDVEGIDELYLALLGGERSFWEAVREPFLRRELSREAARAVVARAHEQAGGSLRELARLLHLDGHREYKKLANFLRNHDLLPSR